MINEKVFTPLYRIDLMIYEKALEERRNKKIIRSEVAKTLDITDQHLYRVLRAKQGESGFLSVSQLSRLADYFGCKIDDLLNKDSKDLHNAASPGE